MIDVRTTDSSMHQGEVSVWRGGPPRVRRQGSVLEFGRYSGWTLGQIKRRDPEFLEWLLRVPVGPQLPRRDQPHDGAQAA